MRILAIAALFALLAGPAFAQNVNLMGDKPVDPVAEQKKQESERAYKAATQRIPDQKPVSNDPWGNVRGTNEVPAKTANSKPKAR
jgi:hypothetical protein